MKATLLMTGLMVATLFLSCEQQENATEKIEKTALEQGNKISDSTQKVLASNLKMAIKEGGLRNAVSYCNLQAMPLTSDMEKKFGAGIKRTSFKVRNPDDAPTEVEKEILSRYDSIHSTGGKLQPRTQWLNQQTVLYTKPIMIGNSLCLNCHGKVGKNVADSFYTFIQEKYPEDEAIGYEMGDLRGMWSITFEKAGLEE